MLSRNRMRSPVGLVLAALLVSLPSSPVTRIARADTEVAVPAGIKSGYQSIVVAMQQKNPGKIMDVWAAQYMSNQHWNYLAPRDEMMTRQQAATDLRSAFPGNEYGPSAAIGIRTGQRNGDKFIVDGLWYVVVPRERGNADGSVQCTDTWILAGKEWKLLSHIAAPPGSGAAAYDEGVKEYSRLSQAGKVIKAPGPPIFSAPELMSVPEGEIGLRGTVQSFDWDANTLILKVTEFALPNGRTKTLTEPKDKTIFFGEIKLVHTQDRPKVQSAVLSNLEKKTVFVKGIDQGAGKTLKARELIILTSE